MTATKHVPLTESHDPRRAVATPELTIVIPTYSRPAKLRACLDGIVQLDIERERLEVVVVDDGSEESLDAVLDEYKARVDIRLMVRARGGPGAARNDGAAAGMGRFLAFIDDDCVPAPGWLSALQRELKRRPDCLLGGQIANSLPNNPYSSATHRIVTYVQEYYRTKGGNEPFFTTNNMAVSADRFRELDGFDTSIPSATAEDKEFCDRWRARDYAMAYVPDAIVYHAHDLTLRSFLKQHYNYGRGIVFFRLTRRRSSPSRLIPEPFSFYWNLLLSAMDSSSWADRFRDAALALASQLATVAGALSTILFERPPPRPEQEKSGFLDRTSLVRKAKSDKLLP
jgi:glycosyltransferase involved in cell wall biosynthesis